MENKYWNELPKNAYVTLNGRTSTRSYVYHEGRGVCYVVYWSGKDAREAQAFLDARVKATEEADWRETEPDEYETHIVQLDGDTLKVVFIEPDGDDGPYGWGIWEEDDETMYYSNAYETGVTTLAEAKGNALAILKDNQPGQPGYEAAKKAGLF